MKHTDLPRVLRRAVGLMRFAREAVGANEASLFLLDAAGTSLRGVVSEWDWTRTSFGAEIRNWPTVAKCLEDGEVRVIAASDATDTEREWFEPRGIVSTVCVPLWDGKSAHGVLFFDFEAAADPFDPEDAPLLKDVGYRCARAIAREGTLDRLPLERATVGTAPSLAAESQRNLESLLNAAVDDVAVAERLLEEAVKAMREGTKEKIVVEPTIERAFARVRAAREELTRISALISAD